MKTAVATNEAIGTRRDKRRRAILDAANALFLEKGFEATTLSEIVARSGGSLATLYELFGNKPGLLDAMVVERCDRIAEIIDSVALADLEPAEALRAIARQFFDLLNDTTGIALFRVIVAEAHRQPELGRAFYEAGPAAGRRTMARYLAGQAARGGLRIDDAEEAATFFFHMLLGDRQMRLLCGLEAETSGSEVERHINRTVDAFVRLYTGD